MAFLECMMAPHLLSIVEVMMILYLIIEPFEQIDIEWDNIISISIPEGKHDAAMLLPKVICMISYGNEISETEIKCFVWIINKIE